MKIYVFTAISVLLILSGCTQKSEENSEAALVAMAANIIYTNGKIYTVNETHPWPEARLFLNPANDRSWHAIPSC